MDTLAAWLNAFNNFIWGPALLVLILGTGLYLQVRLKGMPIRNIARGFRMVWQGRSSEWGSPGDISPFSALMTSLAATIGTGNVAGVATAIALGGPGAVFWMWITALVGMATKYAEVVLAVHYRERDENGHWVGGPMYAIRNGLGKNWKWLGIAFAVFGGLAGFGIGNMVQANSIAAALQSTFGISTTYTGIGLLVVTASVILGGIKRIAAVANWLVPFMAVGYIAAALLVLAMHAADIPEAFTTIVANAFTPTAATGGFAGAAMIAGIRYGVARGIFSNEAGLGTAGIAQAAGASSDPVRSGIIGMMGTFIDTIIVCSMTGLAVVVSGVWTSGKSGVELTQLAFDAGLPGFGAPIVALSILVFAATTIFGWAYYGERCWQFLLGPKVIKPYRVLWCIAVYFGAVAHFDLAWTLADSLNALMAIPNLIALLALSPVLLQLTRDRLETVLATSARISGSVSRQA